MAANEETIVHQGIQVPKGKQTALGLYVTAREAYEIWKKRTTSKLPETAAPLQTGERLG